MLTAVPWLMANTFAVLDKTGLATVIVAEFAPLVTVATPCVESVCEICAGTVAVDTTVPLVSVNVLLLEESILDGTSMVAELIPLVTVAIPPEVESV